MRSKLPLVGNLDRVLEGRQQTAIGKKPKISMRNSFVLVRKNNE
jgi:hypothetical protein